MQIIDFQEINHVGVEMHFRHWQVDDARAVVCIVHGLGEHIGRYEHVAKLFAENKIATIGFDHQGHGRTKGKRGHTHGLDTMMDDVGMLVNLAKLRYPNLPVFVYGQSMGGNVALNYALRRNPKISGLIATNSWIRLPVSPSPFLILFGRTLNAIMPSFTKSNGLDINELSTDSKVVDTYRNDPLVHDRISVRAGTSLLDGGIWLNQHTGNISFPILLMHGGNDSITSPQGTAELAKRLKGDVTWKEWPGLKHELHNEPEQDKVLAFLLEWIKRFI